MNETGEIIKSGAATHLTDLLRRVAGPTFDEWGAILGDRAKVFRLKNLIKMAEKAQRILDDAGVQPGAIPSRLLLPIMESSSAEDNDDLQERWAGLLASASQEGDSMSPSFIDTLKQLTPAEAKHFDRLFSILTKLYKRAPNHHDPVPFEAFTTAWDAPSGAGETYERLGFVRREFDVKLRSDALLFADDPEFIPSTVNDIEVAIDKMSAEVGSCYFFTSFGLRFFEACQGPRKADAQA